MLLRHFRLLLCCGLFFLATNALQSAQESQGGNSQQPTTTASPSNTPQAKADNATQIVYESATVLRAVTRLVVVDVVATKDGKPVEDLKQDDFSVWENDKQQQIKAFSFQHP